MPNPILDYKLAVVAGLQADGYAEERALALAYRNKMLIAEGFYAGVSHEIVTRQIVERDDSSDSDDDPDRTPLQDVTTVHVPRD